jgi:hypothetical protein
VTPVWGPGMPSFAATSTHPSRTWGSPVDGDDTTEVFPNRMASLRLPHSLLLSLCKAFSRWGYTVARVRDSVSEVTGLGSHWGGGDNLVYGDFAQLPSSVLATGCWERLHASLVPNCDSMRLHVLLPTNHVAPQNHELLIVV